MVIQVDALCNSKDELYNYKGWHFYLLRVMHEIKNGQKKWINEKDGGSSASKNYVFKYNIILIILILYIYIYIYTMNKSTRKI